MAHDPTQIDPPKKPPPTPADAQHTTVDSAFVAPPKETKAVFAAPPPEPSKYADAPWLTGRVDIGRGTIASGPPKILGIVCGGWLLFTFFQLWVWEPSEIIVPFCPGIAGITTLVLAVYTWSGRNWARLFAMINAAAWAIGAVIVMQESRTILGHEHLAPGAMPIAVVRASFEIFAGYALNRPECVAFFELRKPFTPKM